MYDLGFTVQYTQVCEIKVSADKIRCTVKSTTRSLEYFKSDQIPHPTRYKFTKEWNYRAEDRVVFN